jgi:sugar/nucleoside kinase (ribokinase family)
MKKPVFGLIGTISKDEIAHKNGPGFTQLGGILYQAAVLCALGEETLLFANVPESFNAEVQDIIGAWPTLQRDGLRNVSGPGNMVHLFYPEEGERLEVLESTVPALEPDRVTRVSPQLSMLIMVVNSGYDMALEDWRKVAAASGCPVWFDVHSLTLTRVLGEPRSYRAVPEWKDWAEGVSYLQANRQEIACMLGHPERHVTPTDIERISREALDLGLKAVFVTLGKEGGLAVTRDRSERIGLSDSGRPVDTTGCGDVFCAATASRLVHGADPITAASFGIRIASRAAFSVGVRETFDLARRFQLRLPDGP